MSKAIGSTNIALHDVCKSNNETTHRAMTGERTWPKSKGAPAAGWSETTAGGDDGASRGLGVSRSRPGVLRMSIKSCSVPALSRSSGRCSTTARAVASRR